MSQIERDVIRLPLSVIHLIEHLRDEQPDRRQRLATVFEHFSRSWFIASWTDILPVEISCAVAQTFNTENQLPIPEIFGRGFLFGVSVKARTMLPKNWSSENMSKFSWLAAQSGALFNLLTFPNEPNRTRQKQRITDLDNHNASAIEDLRAVREPYKKDMHRRAQYASYTYEHQDQLRVALNSIGRTFDDFIALGIDGLTQFWSMVPSLDVDCELTLYRDRQWHRKIQANDVRDIGYLALAVPYCDIVVVERFWARALQETGLANKYRVTVCADLSELSMLFSN